MIDTFAPQRPPRGIAGRFLGVLTSPRSTYAEIAERPAWLGLTLVILLLMAVPMAALMSTAVGRQALVDGQIQAVEAFGRTVSDAQYQVLERLAAFAPYLSVVNTFVLLPIEALVVAGLAAAIFGGLLGGNATFSQVFAVVAGSGAVLALRTLFAVPLDYVRATLTSPANLASVMPFFEDDTFPARLLGSIDLFVIWWMLNLAIGLAVLYKRRTMPIAATFVGVYLAVGLILAIVRSVLAGA